MFQPRTWQYFFFTFFIHQFHLQYASVTIEVPADGIYTFALLSDDGSTLMLDGELLGDNDGAHSPVEIIVQKALKAGLHPIEVRYFDCNGGVLQMELVNEKSEKEVLPSTWLKHE